MTLRSTRYPPLRKRQLLVLLHALGGHLGARDFQKLLFLYCQELDNTAPYEFIPYQYGAFSFTSYYDRRQLTARGLLEVRDSDWNITSTGSAIAREFLDPCTVDFAKRVRHLRGRRLVAETYRRFPYYATRSQLLRDVLGGDTRAISRIEAALPTAVSKGGPIFFTIGYEGRSLENYLNALLRDCVTTVCDVRRNPISRKYGFSKSTLSRACEGVGIGYVHFRELGIESSRRRGLAPDDYEALFSEYEGELVGTRAEALERIRRLLQQGGRVALTCYERRSVECHRGRLATAIQRLAPEFGVVHL